MLQFGSKFRHYEVGVSWDGELTAWISAGLATPAHTTAVRVLGPAWGELAVWPGVGEEQDVLSCPQINADYAVS